MNHRDYIDSADKRAKFGFLKLPEELQDEIFDALDEERMTLQQASALVKERGYPLSHEAIAGYLRAVRRERRLYDLNSEISRLIADFASQPLEESLHSLIQMVIASTAVGIADGKVGIKDIDLGKFLAAVRNNVPKNGAHPPSDADATRDGAYAPKPEGLTDAAAEKIKEAILLGR